MAARKVEAGEVNMTSDRRAALFDIFVQAAVAAQGDGERIIHHMQNFGRAQDIGVTAEECNEALGMTVAELAGIEVSPGRLRGAK